VAAAAAPTTEAPLNLPAAAALAVELREDAVAPPVVLEPRAKRAQGAGGAGLTGCENQTPKAGEACAVGQGVVCPSANGDCECDNRAWKCFEIGVGGSGGSGGSSGGGAGRAGSPGQAGEAGMSGIAGAAGESGAGAGGASSGEAGAANLAGEGGGSGV
jgi:hypothetical protein